MSEGARTRTAERLAAGIWIASALMLMAAIALQIVNRKVRIEIFGFRGADGILGLPAATIGLLIIRRRPRNPIGWLWLAAGVMGGGLTALSSEYSVHSLVRHGGSLPLTGFMAMMAAALWVPTMGALFVAMHLFPTGTLQSRRWGGALAVTIVGCAGFTAAFLVYPNETITGQPSVNPFAISRASADFLLEIFAPIFLAGIVTAIASLVARYRKARGVEREQIRWLIPSLAVVLLMMVLNVMSAFGGWSGPAERVVPVATIMAISLVFAAAGVAILRYRLYDIEVIINRTVVVGIVVAFITAVYVAIVAGVGAAVGSRSGSNVALPIVATAFVAVAFQPVRARAGKVADKMVYGKSATPVEAVSGFLEAASTDDLASRVARLVVEASAVRSATVWLRAGDQIHPVASWPESSGLHEALPVGDRDVPQIPGATTTYPLEQNGELLGMLSVAVAASETIPRDDDRLIAALAGQASHVLRTLLDAAPLPSGVITFLMTDIEGSTRLWEQWPDAMAEALSMHDRLIRDLVRLHRGVLVKSRGEGDSTFSVFVDPADALSAAIAIQAATVQQEWPTPRSVRVRAAVHTGSAQLRDRDYYGPVINRCARLRAVASGGQTLVSGATYELGRGSLPAGATLVDLGTHRLKDLVDEERVYQLCDPRLPSEFPPLPSASNVAPHTTKGD